MLIFSLLFVALITIVFLCFVLFDKPANEGFDPTYDQRPLPFVSVLIAVRNESHHIKKMLDSFCELNYPQDAYELLIGDDHSTDDSLALLYQYAPSNARIVSANESRQYGKLEMLRKLTCEAKGEYLLFTDADVEVNPDWIDGMISIPDQKSVLNLGVTSVKGDGWFDRLQNIDWLFNQKVISWISKHLGPLTAWGNNMSIKKQGFDEIQGYDGIENSIIEDVDLMNKLTRQGGNVSVTMNQKVAVKTNPCTNLKQLLHQRVRWLSGLGRAKWYFKIAMIVKMSFLPSVLILGLIQPYYLFLIPIKVLMTYLITRQVLCEIRAVRPVFSYLYFDFYEFGVNFLTFVLYLLPIKVIWKGRKY